jgi:hypothetical protein
MNLSKRSSSNFTEFIGDVTDLKSKQSASNFSQFIDIESKPSVGNMTEYIGDVSARDAQVRYDHVSEAISTDERSKSQESKTTNEDGNWFRGLSKSFEEEGIFGLSFGIVNAVTSTAINVVTGTASNVGNMLTNHEHNERRIVKDKYAPDDNQEKKGAVLQFASYIADIVLSTVSPVLDLHFFGFSPNPRADVQLSVYWDSPSIKKSIGYLSGHPGDDNVSFMGTESVYFDTRSVGFFSAITGDERSVAESMMTDDFYSAVSKEEAEELEVEFV